MGSDTNCNNDNNYYVNQNNPVSNFYERINLPNNEWIQNSGIDTSRQHNCQENEKNNEQKSNRNYVQNSHNQHNWNYPSNPFRLYNDTNPYGIVPSSTSSAHASTFVPSASNSAADGNNPLTVQSEQPHLIKRVFFQGLNIL